MANRAHATVLAVVVLLGVSATDLQGQGTRHSTAKTAAVRQAVQRFYDAFNAHGFDRAAEFTTDDWVHINPNGGIARGRTAVLAELREVHASFLKGVSDTPDSIAVRFATPDVAVAIVPSRMTTFTTPDGVRHENELHVRTIIVVRRAGAWRIMQDQNTIRAR